MRTLKEETNPRKHPVVRETRKTVRLISLNRDVKRIKSAETPRTHKELRKRFMIFWTQALSSPPKFSHAVPVHAENSAFFHFADKKPDGLKSTSAV
jgi:hypothetical protein